MSNRSACCPEADRIEGRETISGYPIIDLHRHKGMLRGLVVEGEKNRVLHWIPGGRLSASVGHPHDIRRAG